jgi:hypothetical protein
MEYNSDLDSSRSVHNLQLVLDKVQQTLMENAKKRDQLKRQRNSPNTSTIQLEATAECSTIFEPDMANSYDIGMQLDERKQAQYKTSTKPNWLRADKSPKNLKESRILEDPGRVSVFPQVNNLNLFGCKQ